MDLFYYIKTIWSTIDERQRTKLYNKILENFNQIIETDPIKAYELFCIFFKMDLGKVLKSIGKNEFAQYGILKVKYIVLFRHEPISIFAETKIKGRKVYFCILLRRRLSTGYLKQYSGVSMSQDVIREGKDEV